MAPGNLVHVGARGSAPRLAAVAVGSIRDALDDQGAALERDAHLLARPARAEGLIEHLRDERAERRRIPLEDERLRFVNRLPRKLPAERLAELDRTLGLSATRNSEVLFAWLELAVANRYDPAVPALERFLTVQGRRKFVRPLIEALAKDAGWGRPIAERVYRQARPLYHPITTRDLDKLGLI